jgi:hypothetical protein
MAVCTTFVRGLTAYVTPNVVTLNIVTLKVVVPDIVALDPVEAKGSALRWWK